MHPKQQADRRGLAGVIRPEIAINLALADIEVEGVKCDGRPVALG
jgi:hypothetical protein